MPRIAFCRGCNRYIQLTPEGECREGHPRSALRDVRDGMLDQAPVIGTAVAAPTAEQAALSHYDSIGAKVAGKAIVIVPVALVVAWGLWTGMEEFSGSGMPWIAKLGWALFSLALTVGGAFLFAGSRRR
jgi:hypothetical protein